MQECSLKESRRRNWSKLYGYGLVFFLLFGSLASTGCSSSEGDGHVVRFLRWRCEDTKEFVLCKLSMRSHVHPGEEVALVAEYLDESGKKINLCDACQKPQRQDGQKDIDPQKPWYVLMAFKGDTEFWNIMAGAPASRGIRRYRFYFQDVNSGKTVSNIVEGDIARPEPVRCRRLIESAGKPLLASK